MPVKSKLTKRKAKISKKDLAAGRRPSVLTSGWTKNDVEKLSKEDKFLNRLQDLVDSGLEIDEEDIPDDMLDVWEEFKDDIKPKLAKKNWLLWSAIFTPLILPGYVTGLSGKVELPPDAKKPSVQVPAPNPTQIKDYAKEYFREHGLELCKTLTETDLKALKDQMTANWGKGEDFFKSSFQEDYVDSKARLDTIYRTEYEIAQNEGIMTRAKHAGHEFKVWNCALDERSCPVCSSMHGQIAPIDEPFPGTDFMRPQDSHPNCYSDDTEVFTEHGWKLFKDVNTHEKIWTLNPNTKLLELDDQVNQISYDYQGDMIHFKNKTLDCLVTPDHMMLVQKSYDHEFHKERPYVLKKATDVSHGDRIPRSANWMVECPDFITIGDKTFSYPDYMEFMGWFLSEGHIHQDSTNSWHITISQHKKDYLSEIESLCRRMFGYVRICKENGFISGFEVRTNDPICANYFIQFGHSYDKFIPTEVLNSNKHNLLIFLQSFVKGDGSIECGRPWKGHPEWKFRDYLIASSSSPKMINGLTEIALKLGLRPVFRTQKAKPVTWSDGKTYTAKHDQLCIDFCNINTTSFIPAFRKIVPYSGKVYCLEMKNNHNLYVRRNGKANWSGNCRCVLTSIKSDDLDQEGLQEDASYLSDVGNFMKLNYRCKKEEQQGEGPGSCTKNASLPDSNKKNTSTLKLTKEERAHNEKIKRLQAKIDHNNKLISSWGDSHFLTDRVKKETEKLNNEIQYLKESGPNLISKLPNSNNILSIKSTRVYNERMNKIVYNNSVTIYSPIGKEQLLTKATFDVINKMPTAMQHLAKNLNYVYTTEEDPTDDENSSTTAYFDPTKNRVTFYGFKGKTGFEYDPILFAEDLIHELAHKLDPNQRLSSSSEYKKAVTLDGDKYVTKYATNFANDHKGARFELVEDFAEGVMKYSVDSEKFKYEFPNRYAYFKSILDKDKNISNDLSHTKQNEIYLNDVSNYFMKLSANCKQEEKVGGEHPCSGSQSDSPEPERWKVSNFMANLDVGFDVHLPEKTARLIFKQGTKFNDKIRQERSHSPGAQGLTAHGTNGPEIWYNKITGVKNADDEGIYNEALHELGHSLEYPYKNKDGNLAKLAIWKDISAKDLHSDLLKLGYSSDRYKGLSIDLTDPSETWADLFQLYNNPRMHLKLREGLPEIHKKLTSVLGKSDYDIPISEKEKHLFKKLAEKGWNLKQSDLKELNIDDKQFEEISDLISPSYSNKPESFISNTENYNYPTRMKKLRDMFVEISPGEKLLKNTEATIRETTINLWKSGITDSERKSITAYKMSNYQDFNSYLRTGRVFGNTLENEQWIKNNINNIDSLLEKSKLTKDITTYRYVSKGFAESKLVPNVGKSITEPGYMSTSYFEPVAKNAGNGQGAYMTIRVPSGTGIADLDSLATSEMMEYEVLLERGLTLHIKDHKVLNNGMDWFDVEVSKQKQDSNYLDDVTDFIKLNYNCPDSQKNGSEHPCSGNDNNQPYINPRHEQWLYLNQDPLDELQEINPSIAAEIIESNKAGNDDTYNCMGMVARLIGSKENLDWVDSEEMDQMLQDNAQQVEEAQKGDILVYRSEDGEIEHIGINVDSANGLVLSKAGSTSIQIDDWDKPQGYDYGSPNEVWRPKHKENARYLEDVSNFIKLNYKCPKGTIDESNKCRDQESINGIPDDVNLDRDKFASFYQASKRNVFNFRAIKDKDSYSIVVSPKKIPDNWKTMEEDENRKSYFDPEYYEAKPLSEGSSIISMRRKKDYTDTLEGKEEGHLFRGMSYDEYEGILKNGFVQSKGDYNFDNQEGLTYFSTDKGQASYYASGFAPWQYQATPDKPAVMITVKEPPKERQNTVLASGSDEVGIKGKVPKEDIVDVYFGYPVAVTEGYFEARGQKKFEPGSSIGYTSRIRWEKQEKQKLNYNCPKSEKNGEGPGSCSNKSPLNLGNKMREKISKELPLLEENLAKLSTEMSSIDKNDKSYKSKKSEIAALKKRITGSKKFLTANPEPKSINVWELADKASFIKQNRKCKVGTYDDTNACGPQKELLPNIKEVGKGYEFRTNEHVNPENLQVWSDGKWIDLKDKRISQNSSYLEDVSDFIKLNYRCEFNGTDWKCPEWSNALKTNSVYLGEVTDFIKLNYNCPTSEKNSSERPCSDSLSSIKSTISSSVLNDCKKIGIQYVRTSIKQNSLYLSDVADFLMKLNYGTSEGAKKAWDTRGRGRKEDDEPKSVKPVKFDVRSSETFKSVLETFKQKKTDTLHKEDHILHSIAKEINFDGLPHVLSANKLSELVANGGILLFRGVSKPEFSEALKNGEYFAGTGMHGNGTYAAMGQNGFGLAVGYAGNQDNCLNRMALDKNAKIIDGQLLRSKMAEELSKIESNDIESNAYYSIISDPGRYAMVNGYDAISYNDIGIMVILNRSKLYIQDEPIKQNDYNALNKIASKESSLKTLSDHVKLIKEKLSDKSLNDQQSEQLKKILIMDELDMNTLHNEITQIEQQELKW